MSKSYYLSNALLNQVLGGSAYSAPATVYVALFTVTPGPSGTGGTEVSFSNNYSRVSVTSNSTNWPAASSGTVSNGTAITFPTASGSWGTVVTFGIYDLSTGGNLLFYGNLTTAITVINLTAVNFPIGTLSINEQ